MRLILVALLFAAGGCSRMPWGSPAPISESRWTHETKTRQDFERDRYECEMENRGVKRARISELRDRCMLVRGWQRR